MTPSRLAGGYQRLGRTILPSSSGYAGEGDISYFRNIRTHETDFKCLKTEQEKVAIYRQIP
jgi:hypothetical protein